VNNLACYQIEEHRHFGCSKAYVKTGAVTSGDGVNQFGGGAGEFTDNVIEGGGWPRAGGIYLGGSSCRPGFLDRHKEYMYWEQLGDRLVADS
jgi:hypothetical protein